MVIGFAIRETGLVMKKNSSQILMKYMFNSMLTIILYFTCGYALTYGSLYSESKLKILGSKGFIAVT